MDGAIAVRSKLRSCSGGVQKVRPAVDDSAEVLSGGRSSGTHWGSGGATGAQADEGATGSPVGQCRQPRLPESWSPMGSIVFLPLLLSTSGRNVHGSPGQTDKIPQGGKCNILDGNWPACRSLQRPRLLSHSLAPQKKRMSHSLQKAESRNLTWAKKAPKTGRFIGTLKANHRPRVTLHGITGGTRPQQMDSSPAPFLTSLSTPNVERRVIRSISGGVIPHRN